MSSTTESKQTHEEKTRAVSETKITEEPSSTAPTSKGILGTIKEKLLGPETSVSTHQESVEEEVKRRAAEAAAPLTPEKERHPRIPPEETEEWRKAEAETVRAEQEAQRAHELAAQAHVVAAEVEKKEKLKQEAEKKVHELQDEQQALHQAAEERQRDVEKLEKDLKEARQQMLRAENEQKRILEESKKMVEPSKELLSQADEYVHCCIKSP